MILFLALVAAQPTDHIELRCMGGGAATKFSGGMASMYDNRGYRASGNFITGHRDAYDDQVDVIIDADASKIRLPRSLLPAIRGGKDGWFKLKNLEVSDDAISASGAVSMVNNPKIHIDRRSGFISINGKTGHYEGRCEKIDATEPKRF